MLERNFVVVGVYTCDDIGYDGGRRDRNDGEKDIVDHDDEEAKIGQFVRHDKVGNLDKSWKTFLEFGLIYLEVKILNHMVGNVGVSQEEER